MSKAIDQTPDNPLHNGMETGLVKLPSKLPIGLADHNVAIRSEDGKESVLVLLDPRPRNRRRGNQPRHEGMAQQLKGAFYAEAWISLHVLQELDIRSLMPEDYPDPAHDPDPRSSAIRQRDAYALIEFVLEKMNDVVPSLFIRDGTFSTESLTRWGREAVKSHYPAVDLRDLHRSLRPGQLSIARATDPNVTDEQIARMEIEKLCCLLVALARAKEWSLAAESIYRGNGKRRGRPSKAPDIVHPNEITYKSRVDCPEPDGLRLIALHSGTNPADLWTNQEEARDMLACSVVMGKLERDQILTDEDNAFMERYIVPLIARGEEPRSEIERYVRDAFRHFIMGVHAVAQSAGS